jgi:hypothetical protein
MDDGAPHVFHTLDAYNKAHEDGGGNKMASVLATIQWFLKGPCQSMPKFGKDGCLIADEHQDAP